MEIIKSLIVGKVITSELLEIWRGLTDDGQGGRRHNLIVGEVQVGDNVLFNMKCQRSCVLLGHQGEIVRFPTIGMKNVKEISSVIVYDEWDDDTGGEARIIMGGIGADYVEIQLSSRFMRGYSFTITIFGK
jgi:hypothetical protein